MALAAACPAPRPPVPPPRQVRAPDPPAPPHVPPPGKVEQPRRVRGPLVLQGTPEIPPALRDRLSQYLNVRAADLNALADNGRSMLVTTRFASTSQVHLVTTPLGVRRQLTFEDEPVRDASFVPGSTDALLYVSDVGGDEQYQIFRHDLGTGKTELLTDGKSRHGTYVWSHDGKRVAYAGNARNGRDMDLYLGDGRSAAGETLLLERKGHWIPLDWSHDGSRLLVGEYISINDTRLYVVDVRTKEVVRVSPESPPAAYRSALFAKDGRRIFVTTDREGEFVALYELDLPRGRWRPLSRTIPWNVEQIALSPNGRRLAFSVNEEGYSVLYLLDVATGRVRRAPGVPRGIIVGLRFARRAPVLGFTLLGPTYTGDAYTYHLRTGALTRWTLSEVGGLNPDRFVEPVLTRYRTFDGREIPAFLFKPGGAGPHPVAVWIHGGPEAQARPYFSAMMQYLVGESGIAVLVPNVRGSDGYGKSYLLLDNHDKREDSVRDIGALLDWIGDRPDLDAGRVAVFGGSYGGYMVLASLVSYAGRIVAGVDIVGISNFVTFLKHTKAYRRDLRRAEYGDERDPRMHDFLQRISPSTNAHRIRSALFVAHGANDPRVPLSETDQIVEAVRKQGNEVWYMVARNEGHGFRKKENRDIFYLLTVLFLEKHLGANRQPKRAPVSWPGSACPGGRGGP
jgi:dipeptidyl aminopeptidase/acylaminoacyl peptidase